MLVAGGCGVLLVAAVCYDGLLLVVVSWRWLWFRLMLVGVA